MDLLLELIAIFFEGSISKKAKKWVDENFKKNKESPMKSRGEKGMTIGQTSVSCNDCHRILKEFPVYEQGKPLCVKCYKTQVLKLR